MSVPLARGGGHPKEQAPPATSPGVGDTVQHTAVVSRPLAGRPESYRKFGGTIQCLYQYKPSIQCDQELQRVVVVNIKRASYVICAVL